ncbi:hypothetical protein FHG87_006066 [Trinorchestia longiramus]|nr:hypothetical protein FHG87_006066 [Trinorchestia longiramus]
MRNLFIELFHLSNNLQMARDCCNADTKCLRWILLNNRMQLLVLETTQTSSTLFIFKALITTPEFPEPPSYCPIPCGLFSPCSVNIGRSFGGVVPKVELVQLSNLGVTQSLKPADNLGVTQSLKPAGNLCVGQSLKPAGNLSVTQSLKPAGNLSVGQSLKPVGNLGVTQSLKPARSLQAPACNPGR